MSTLERNSLFVEASPYVYDERVPLSDDHKTGVHVVRQPINEVTAHIVSAEHAARLTDLCDEFGDDVVAAMSGGFFSREAERPIGEVWINGEVQPHVPFMGGWHKTRGVVHFDEGIWIGGRNMMPSHPDSQPSGNLLQAGPLLVVDGRIVVPEDGDIEGFTATAPQHDSDITDGRHPRAAIGYDEEYIYSVAVDGRTEEDAGMTIKELAAYMAGRLGVHAALNLDGGGSTTLVTRDPDSGLYVVNNPMDGIDMPTPGGSRPIHSAIIFTRR